MSEIDRSTWMHRITWALPLVITVLLPGPGALVALGIVIAALLAFKEARKPTIAFVARSCIFSALVGVTAGIGIYLAFEWLIDPVIETVTGSPIDLSAYAAVEGDLGAFILLLALGILFGGIVEEFVYRGFTIGWGTRLLGNRSGPLLALLSGVVFGTAHLYQGPAGVLSTGLIGTTFGILYLILDKKLLPVMMAHMIVNVLGITRLYLGH